jgi:hypothetical protein
MKVKVDVKSDQQLPFEMYRWLMPYLNEKGRLESYVEERDCSIANHGACIRQSRLWLCFVHNNACYTTRIQLVTLQLHAKILMLPRLTYAVETLI